MFPNRAGKALCRISRYGDMGAPRSPRRTATRPNRGVIGIGGTEERPVGPTVTNEDPIRAIAGQPIPVSLQAPSWLTVLKRTM